jgi:hypothetical protein
MLKPKIKQAIQALNQAFKTSCGGDFCLQEGDENLNQASRNVISAYGEGCWLGFINPHTEKEKENLLWQWGKEPITNFGSDFVIPQFDEELLRLMKERLETPYEGTQKDKEKIDAIYKRVEEIGGASLVWS